MYIMYLYVCVYRKRHDECFERLPRYGYGFNFFLIKCAHNSLRLPPPFKIIHYTPYIYVLYR